MAVGSIYNKDEILDIEEELTQHFIRQYTGSRNNLAQDADVKIHEIVPLLLKDVRSAVIMPCSGSKKVFKTLLGRVSFCTCVSYARIVGLRPNNKYFYKYVIDDGTAIVEISVPRRERDIQHVYRLQTEVESMKVRTKVGSVRDMSMHLEKVLSKTKEHLHAGDIPIGSKVLVHGFPTVFRGNTCMDALCVYRDDQCKRDIEIAFKDHLINWYQHNVLTGNSTNAT